MSSIIEVKDLSKKFIISHEGQERYTTFRDTIARNTKKVFSFAKSSQLKKAKSYKEEFYALKDIGFTIEQGDRVGIIGRNGAGKSTLLKILSRITEPSSGEIKIKGRVASLLEVGTGFHPELTGRENIFLNGAILGMSRIEIKRKFDEIVDFAQIEKFLDTPVKRYSSGMYVRLAFAVAAHLESEILIVDEVLSVGDSEFQKKCLGKMGEISKGEGRTVMFVSHNIDSIRQLCDIGIQLENGLLVKQGSIDLVLENYLKTVSSYSYTRTKINPNNPSIVSVKIDQEDLAQGILNVDIRFQSPHRIAKPNVGLVLYNLFGVPLFGSNSKLHQTINNNDMDKGTAKMKVELPLHSGSYKISVFLGDSHVHYDTVEDVLTFDFISSDKTNTLIDTKNIGPLNIKPVWVYE